MSGKKPLSENFIKLIKSRRVTLQLSQQEVAARSGLSRAYISRLEVGSVAMPGSDMLPALAMGLEVSEDSLREALGIPLFREPRTLIIPEGWAEEDIKSIEEYIQFREWKRKTKDIIRTRRS